ncbi:MAG: T9SS type A sorting domain-containing protein, partial [Bacteroidetes bacterium]
KVYRVTSGIGNGAVIDSAMVVYRVNNGAWQTVGMTAPQAGVDSTYYGTIPKQAAGATVQYFIKVRDKANLTTHLANSATLVQFDTSKGTFFYKSLDRAAQPVLTIRDVQYTPFINGRTPYLGAVDSVGGIVTADTSSLRISALTAAGTNAWYMQSGNQPYGGIWISGPDSVMTKLRNGDSVVVKGNISETNEVTRITNITSARVVATGLPLPAPVVLKTTVFGPGATNGTFAAEQYEGMLVRFDTVVVTDVSPVFDQPTEFEISNGGQAVLVRRDGKHTYSNVPADSAVGMTILRAGNKIASLTGIIFYNNNRYKFVPRSNADFVGVSLTGVRREQAVATAYGLDQNYPNPFNPATTIRYAIPQAGSVTLKVFNVIGQEVATLVNERQERGVYSVKFDASRLASGLYLYRVTAGDFVQVKKMMLVK